MDIEKRFEELARRADERCYTTFSDFLNVDEENVLAKTVLPVPFRIWGGYDGAERCVAAFGYNVENEDYPISIVEIKPVAPKFADFLSHRDFLGSLMGLGIKREMLGDIIVKDNTGYLFCVNTMADYISSSLDKVRHTVVKCTVINNLPDVVCNNTVDKDIIVSSIRIDAVVAAVYNFSRSGVKEYFLAGKIFVNSAPCENFSYNLKNGDVVSVRGKGRFVFEAVGGSTKKNKNIVKIKMYV